MNKDWEDYLKYREEKDKRDKQFYKDYFPWYEYDANEYHTHDEHCAIGARAEVTFDVPDVSFDMIQIYIQVKESYDDLVKQEDEFVNDK